jgi:hypothetical protein
MDRKIFIKKFGVFSYRQRKIANAADYKLLQLQINHPSTNTQTF